MFDFRAWMKERAEGSGSAAEKLLVLVEPVADLPEQVASARRAGIELIVCGFLPDEIEWRESAGYELWEWFISRWSFIPYTFDRRSGVGIESRAGVLLLQDAAARNSFGAAEMLAVAIAESRQESLRRVDVNAGTLASLAEQVNSSDFVINAVANWQIGFAVDELAAQEGGRVLRLGNPGYSPLRHALLGLCIPLRVEDGVPHVRRLLAEADWLNTGGCAHLDAGNWFHGGEADSRWKQLFDAPATSLFWDNFSPKDVDPLDGIASGRWLNRRASWTALVAAMDEKVFPAAAFARAEDVMTQYLVAELQAKTRGLIRSAALPRWVRLRPEWLTKFSRHASGMREAKQLMERWVVGIGVPGLSAPSRSLLEVATAETGNGREQPGPLAIVGAWGGDWESLPALVAHDLKPEAPLRKACVDLCWARSGELTAQIPIPPGLADVLHDEKLWSASMGTAGRVLRIAVAWRWGEVSRAVRWWREGRRDGTLPVDPGLGRIVQAVTSDNRALVAWLGGFTGGEEIDWTSQVAKLLARWFHVRLADLWRRHQSAAVTRELRLVNDIAGERSARKGAGPRIKRMFIIGLALAGRVDEALRVFDEIGVKDDAVREAAGHAALAMWVRGSHSGCRAILSAASGPLEEPPRELFARATVQQLLGDLDAASEALARLGASAPGYLSRPTAADTRWVWAALVARRAGLQADADRFLAIARNLLPGSERLFADIESSSMQLAKGWRALGWGEGESQMN